MTNNEMKLQTVKNLKVKMESFAQELKVLEALDRMWDESGAADLNDQLVTLGKNSESLTACLERCERVVPK